MDLRDYIQQTQKYRDQLNTFNKLSNLTPVWQQIASRSVGFTNLGAYSIGAQVHSLSINKRIMEMYKPITQIMQNDGLFKLYADQMNLSKIFAGSAIQLAASRFDSYFDISRRHLIGFDSSSIKLPSQSVIVSTLKEELEEAGFYNSTSEEALQVIEKKIEETKEESEWKYLVYVWLFAFIVNYLIQLATNYASKGEFELVAPSIDMSMFVAKLMVSNTYKYVSVSELAVKVCPRHNAKTVEYLEKEFEVKVIRSRKDWSFVSYTKNSEVKEGWLLTRYIKR